MTQPGGDDWQARIDFAVHYAGDLPWVNLDFMATQADSYFPASQFPSHQHPHLFYPTGAGTVRPDQAHVQLDTSISPGWN